MSSHSQRYYHNSARGYNHGKHSKPECIRAQLCMSYQPQPNSLMRNHQNNIPYFRGNSRPELSFTIDSADALRLFLSGMLVIRIGEIFRRR